MLLSILILFAGACFAPFLIRHLKKYTGYLLAFLPTYLLFRFFPFYSEIKGDIIIQNTYSWISSLNINLSFYLDGLSFLFTILVLVIGILILIYANGYMQSYRYTGKFYSYIMVFMGSMLGLVLSGNLITLFLFWELTSISSFLLIGFHHEKADSRSAALQALLVTGLGGLALLAGLIIMGNISGTFEIVELLNERDALISHALYLPLLLLILLGAFTKSAQFPFHFWLPAAMTAPAPVSAYLHSATMVNAGIYLLARLNPVLGNTPEWQNIISLFGGASMFIGAYFALTQKDIKAILAYSTVSALGILMLLIGIGTYLSVNAALLYLVVHALYKATLFMVAGTIDKTTGTRNIDLLGNLKKNMPLTTIITLLTLLSMAGIPPMLGYISKEFIYEAKLQASGVASYVLFFGVLTNVFMVAISLIFGYKIFFSKTPPFLQGKELKKQAISFWIGPAILAITSLLLALFPGVFEPIMKYAVGSVKALAVTVELQLWHGVNLVLLLSGVTVALGVMIFVFRKTTLPAMEKVNATLFKLEFSKGFNMMIEGLLKFAVKNTRFFQHGYYRFYLMVIFITAAILIWYQLYRTWSWDFLENISPPTFYATGLAVITLVAAFAATFTASRLVAIVTIGVVGYALALLYMIYGAVDLAITQMLVETLTLVLFVMMFSKLPPFIKHLSSKSKVRDGLVALAVGGFMTGLALKSSQMNLGYPVSNYIASHAVTVGEGRNIVNVILVDVRAFDTLGEVMVLTIAALGVYALLKFKLQKKKL